MNGPNTLPSRESPTAASVALLAALGTALLFASPCAVEATPFVRGDVDQNRSIDISDPVFVFNYLFLGGPDPDCLAAADAGDDQAVDISDGIYLLSFLFLGGPAPAPPYPLCGEDPTPDSLGCRFHGYCASCIEAAGEMVGRWREEGRTELEIERLYQAALAECNGPDVDSATASYVGAANVDLARLARLFLSGNMAPAEYLQRMRDRARKLRTARADDRWAVAYVAGDADGDLVPDDLDRCPGTPELEATDDAGCPTGEPLPEAPTRDEVSRAAAVMGVVASDACSEAEPPSSPTPLKFGYNAVDRSTVNIAVTRVKNQPEGCKVFYEIDFRFYSPTRVDIPTIAYAQMVFRDTENTDLSASGESRQVFRVRATDVAGRKYLFDNWKYYQLGKWRVRAVNGSGFKSSWSGYATQSVPSFGEP